MEKINYIVYKEKKGDETHEHDLIEVGRFDTLEKAEEKLNWKENLYGRIDKIRSTYTSPPAGRTYKEERLGWSDEFLETVKEN